MNRTRKLMLSLLILFPLADTILTLMIKYKHRYFNESNLIYLMTNNIWLTLLICWIVISVLFLFYYRYYFKVPDHARFTMIFVLLVFLLSSGSAIANNINTYNVPVEDMVEATPEEMKEYYQEKYFNLNQTERLKKQGQTKIPAILHLYAFMYVNFLVWKGFEGDKPNKD